MSNPEYEVLLFPFLNERKYKALGWTPDKRVRDTGPFINGKYYGTHPAVKIFYSPEMIEWLEGGKQTAIPDGAMIIKEQYEPPAVRYHGLDDDQLFEHLSSWTVMVKDSAGSHDGWYWSNPAKDQQVVDNHEYPFDHPIGGFGIYCVRCHASTESHGETNEYTFSSLRNVKGYPGEPLLFRVDDSWRNVTDHEVPVSEEAEDEADTIDEVVEESPHPVSNEELLAEKLLKSKVSLQRDDLKKLGSHPRCTAATHPEQCAPKLNKTFLKYFPSIDKQHRGDLLHMPPITHDWVVRRPGEAQRGQPFVTSNQCMSCHAGLAEPFGPTMFFPSTENAEYGAAGADLSPYGEWRWTPMGLAGRDPIFFAQLESEIEFIKDDFPDNPAKVKAHVENLVETCLTCHGAMGKHQYRADHGSDAENFGLDKVLAKSNDPHATGKDDWRYGSLARDGISCTICHQMEPREQPSDDHRHYLEYFLETSITGNINVGNANELHGPFEDKEISPYSMNHALGFKPKHNPYIQSSQMCGTCHVVNLPIIDEPYEDGEATDELVAAEHNPLFKQYHHHVEQATYLEWLNSEFENEFNPDNPQAKTCQDCHMSKDYHSDDLDLHLEQIETRIAAIQDDTYPDAENLVELNELQVRLRKEKYARHNFKGLNMFLLEMFNQFDDVLGVRKNDFMTGSTTAIQQAKEDFLRQATNDVAKINVSTEVSDEGQLTADVEVLNQVGHRFPSGVGFRRAFLEFLVVENSVATEGKDRIVWSSGRTNEIGVLLDGDGKPLPSEFFQDHPNPEENRGNSQCCQHHHEVITSQDQVQVYETLLHSADHKFSTSFIHAGRVIKDNRLLPRGWSEKGPGPGLKGKFLEATHPGPLAKNDERYQDGSGSDVVTYKVNLPAGVDPNDCEVHVTLYYQSIPPYFLQSLFETAPNGPATQRLHYICSNMDLSDTPIKDWKLPVTTTTASLGDD